MTVEKVTVRVPEGITSNAEILLNGEPLTCTRLRVELLPNELVHCEIDMWAELDMDFGAMPKFKLENWFEDNSPMEVLEFNAFSYFGASLKKRNRFGYDPRNSLP